MQHNKYIKHINISIHKIDALYMSFKINEYINTLMLPWTERRNIKHSNHINYVIYIINMITINIIFCNTMRKI